MFLLGLLSVARGDRDTYIIVVYLIIPAYHGLRRRAWSLQMSERMEAVYAQAWNSERPRPRLDLCICNGGRDEFGPGHLR